ncbi:helix-turn-helix domain-containing protein [Paraconexibacter sp. AEG42_29]|uniref:TetR/AcrR family transcriptional regulator n=1 Tax=Paraconexibacter sp. AEG42_29 TaxID=2997339 RepID=UPI00339D3D74
MSRDRKILEAAAKLFHERGFAGVSVDEIGVRAGVTGPAIYRHFKGKEEILTSLFDEALDGLLDATVPDGDVGRARLRSIVAGHAEYVVRASELASIWQTESSALSPASRRRFLRRTRSYFERWRTALEDVYPERSDDEIAAAVHCAVTLIGSLAQWPANLKGIDDRVALVTEMTLAALDAAALPAATPSA